MFRKVLFSALTALALAGGVLISSAIPGDTAPVMMSPLPQAQTQGDLIQVKNNCGWWNNYCGNGNNNNNYNNNSNSTSGCVTLGGVQLCVGGTGTNCHWHNGKKYCDNNNNNNNNKKYKSFNNNNNNNYMNSQKCVSVNYKKYCNYKHNGDCITVNGDKYCRF